MAGSGVTHRSADATVSLYGATPITPSNTADIPVTRAVYIGTSGDLKVDMADNTTITLSNVSAGYPQPLQVTRIYADGTTATNIVAFY